jgi:hypothetical protein
MNALIIAGGRDFKNFSLLVERVDVFRRVHSLLDPEDLQIVSGGADGADRLGELYAKNNNLKVVKFPADWEKHGKSAGPIRNAAMATYASHAILFWNGGSPGTKNMIYNAKLQKLKINVVYY